MSTFTLAISCLTASNLPWFMDLTFQVPMQYCSLQHQTLLLSSVPFTAGCCFCFGSISSFFLELFLHWSPVAYWAPTYLGSSSFSVLFFFFLLFILLMGFSRQEYWSSLPFPSPVDHILSDLSTMTCPSWVAPQTWLSFIELDKAVVHVIRLTNFLWLWFQCVCPLKSFSPQKSLILSNSYKWNMIFGKAVSPGAERWWVLNHNSGSMGGEKRQISYL